MGGSPLLLGRYEGGTLFLNDAEAPRIIYAEFRIAIR